MLPRRSGRGARHASAPPGRRSRVRHVRRREGSRRTPDLRHRVAERTVPTVSSWRRGWSPAGFDAPESWSPPSVTRGRESPWEKPPPAPGSDAPAAGAEAPPAALRRRVQRPRPSRPRRRRRCRGSRTRAPVAPVAPVTPAPAPPPSYATWPPPAARRYARRPGRVAVEPLPPAPAPPAPPVPRPAPAPRRRLRLRPRRPRLAAAAAARATAGSRAARTRAGRRRRLPSPRCSDAGRRAGVVEPGGAGAVGVVALRAARLARAAAVEPGDAARGPEGRRVVQARARAAGVSRRACARPQLADLGEPGSAAAADRRRAHVQVADRQLRLRGVDRDLGVLAEARPRRRSCRRSPARPRAGPSPA